MVRDNHIVALIDWEAAGWYPEYWDYVKFMELPRGVSSWTALADEILPERYDNELLSYTGLFMYQEQMDKKPCKSKKGRNQDFSENDVAEVSVSPQ